MFARLLYHNPMSNNLPFPHNCFTPIRHDKMELIPPFSFNVEAKTSLSSNQIALNPWSDEEKAYFLHFLYAHWRNQAYQLYRLLFCFYLHSDRVFGFLRPYKAIQNVFILDQKEPHECANALDHLGVRTEQSSS